MAKKIISYVQTLGKKRYALVAVVVILGVGTALAVGVGGGSAAACSNFMCGYDTNHYVSNNGDAPFINVVSGTSGGVGSPSQPYIVHTGTTLVLNLGFVSHESSGGLGVFDWSNIDYKTSNHLFVAGGETTTYGTNSHYFSNQCIDIVFTTNSPYYNPAYFEGSPNGAVSCDGYYPCIFWPSNFYDQGNNVNEPGCQLYDPSNPATEPKPDPGGFVVNGVGDMAAWYSSSYSPPGPAGSDTSIYQISLPTANPGDFCMRNHVALDTSGGGWHDDASILAANMRDVRAISGGGGGTDGVWGDAAATCFEIQTPVCTPGSGAPGCPKASGNGTLTCDSAEIDTPGDVTTEVIATIYNSTDGVHGDSVLAADTVHHTDADWTPTFQPTSQYVIMTYYNHHHNSDGTWTDGAVATKVIGPCYSASCSITNIVGSGGPASDPTLITSGGSVTFTVTLTNNATAANGELELPGNLNGQLALQGTGGAWGVNVVNVPASTSVTDIITMAVSSLDGPGSDPSYPAYYSADFTPVYYGNFVLGGDCGRDPIDVYQPFTLTPAASAAFVGDPEDPTSVNYSTSVTNSGTPPVQATDTSTFFLTPSQTSSQNDIATSSDTYNYGTHTELSGNYPIPQLRPGDSDVTAGDTYCSEIKIDHTTGYVGLGGPTDLADTSGGGTFPSPPSCQVVVNKPYFKVYGNGVASGGSFSGPADGLLADWNNNSGVYPYNYGGGSELSNIATGSIVGYAGSQQNSSDVRPPPDLNFANTSSGSCSISTSAYTPKIGGCFGSPSPLLTELGLPNPSCWGGLPAAAGTYNYTYGTGTCPGNLTLGSTTINDGQSVYLNVNGNVYINGPITYGGANDGSWNPSNVPSFILNVTGGNIYIAPGVGELDGVYVAEPNGVGSGGIIYTCGQSNFTAMSGASLYTGCNKQLTVYGSFEAKSVNLMRTYGSLRDETPIASATTSTTKYDNPAALIDLTCQAGGGWPSDPYAESHWYEVSGGQGGTFPPATCPNPNYVANDGYIFPTSDTTFTNYVSNNNLYGNYFALCEYVTAISGGDDHYIEVFGDTAGFSCTNPSLPFYNDSPVLLGYVPSSAVSGSELLYENYDGPGGGPCNGAYASTYPPSGCTGYHYYSTTNTAENDGRTVPYVYTGATDISTGAMYGAVPYTVTTTTAAHPPNPPQCSNKSGTPSPSPRLTCAAEIFDYSPEYSLGPPNTSGASTSANSAIEIYNLPPVL